MQITFLSISVLSLPMLIMGARWGAQVEPVHNVGQQSEPAAVVNPVETPAEARKNKRERKSEIKRQERETLKKERLEKRWEVKKKNRVAKIRRNNDRRSNTRPQHPPAPKTPPRADMNPPTFGKSHSRKEKKRQKNGNRGKPVNFNSNLATIPEETQREIERLSLDEKEIAIEKQEGIIREENKKYYFFKGGELKKQEKKLAEEKEIYRREKKKYDDESEDSFQYIPLENKIPTRNGQQLSEQQTSERQRLDLVKSFLESKENRKKKSKKEKQDLEKIRKKYKEDKNKNDYP